MNYLSRKIPLSHSKHRNYFQKNHRLKIKVETTNLYRGKYRNSLCGLGSGKDFLRGQKKSLILKGNK